MLRLLTLLATAAVAIAAPFDIETLASKDALAAAAPKQWSLVCKAAAWPARAGGALEWNPAQQQFIMHGVGIYEDSDSDLNGEVWVGVNTGNAKFTKVSVKKGYNDELLSAITTQDINGVQYRIQGSNRNHDEAIDVWRSSDNGKNWVAQHETAKVKTPLEGNRYLGAAVALITNPNHLVMWGGQSGGNIFEDVYSSTDAGVNWKQVTTASSFGPRSVHVGLASTMKQGDETIDVIYSMMGYIKWDPKAERGVYSNDVWISTGTGTGNSAIGKKWIPINKRAPWAARGDATADITDNGVMVLSSGWASYRSDEDQTGAILNDVWASLDGGYSWGLCAEDADFSDRQFQQSALDGDGVMWVMGGRSANGEGLLNDIWKSVHSFSDVSEVARQCNLLVPSCGAGLKCLPTDDGFQSGTWGVVCKACPGGPLLPAESGETPLPGDGSNSGTNYWTVAAVIFMITTAVAGFAVYHFYKKANAAASGASADQGWWSKNGTSSLVGGDAQTPSDAMYNPLNIRDSNATM